jgi:hypothetical protein
MSARTRTARIRSVEPLEGFALRLGFDDETTREVDLEDELWGAVFEPRRQDPELFRQVRVDEELGTIVWPNPTWIPTSSMATIRRRVRADVRCR